jgi:hypothetical protein
MSEWWTYRLSNFLLFSPQTYHRLFELYNAAIWPAQIAAVAVGLAILLLLVRPERTRSRILAALLVACWCWIAIAFHANHYATINWAAIYFAWAFGLEAALLLWTGVVRGRLVFERDAALARRAGFWTFFFALAVQPLIGLLLGRGWRQIEIFGIAPDPTALATLAILLLATGRAHWHLIVIPAIWCAISGATLLAMEAPDAWVLPLAAGLVVFLAARKSRVLQRGSLHGRAGQET